MIETLRHGVPISAAVAGGFYANRKRASFWKSAGYTLGAWGGAWIGQYLILSMLEGAGQRNLSASMPTAKLRGNDAGAVDYSRPVSTAQAPSGSSGPTLSGGPTYREPAAVAAVVAAAASPATPSGYEGQRKAADGDQVAVKGTFTGGGAFGSAYGGN